MAVADDMQVTTKTAKRYNLNVTCLEPENSIIRYTISSDDFSGRNEFDQQRYDLAVSEKEDFSDVQRVSFETTWNGEHVDAFAYYIGEENTEYYLKLQYYDYTTYSFKDVAGVEIQKVTIKKGIEGCELTPVYIGAGTLIFDAKIDGSIGADIWNDRANSVAAVQLSRDENFETLLGSYGGSFSNRREEGGAYYERIIITGVDIVPENTYYVRLCLRQHSSAIGPVVSDVVKITTKENVVYQDSDIPDEELRNAIKKFAGVLDKAHLEAVTYLGVERQKGTAGIADLKGLELLPCLQELNLSNQMVTDISVLSNCVYLTNVNLTNNCIRTIPDLSALSVIQWLILNGNFIPKDEFKESNSNIPENLRAAYWLQSARATQRESEEIGFILADTYYKNSEGNYPLQVEINNTYSWPEYTLSVYQGDKLVKENVAVTSNASYYNVVDWLLEDLVTSAGSYTFTFVVSADGAEVGRTTKEITFSDEEVYVPNISYLGLRESYAYVYLYVYNTTSSVAKVRLLDSAGTVVVETSQPSQDTNSWDARYNNVFKNNLLRNNPCSVSINYSLNKYLKEDSYTAELVMEDGATYKSGTVLVVTSQPIIRNVSTMSSGYENSVDSNDFYVSVSGINVDWKKLSIELYDGNDKISKSSEYKIISNQDAVYRTVKTSDADWPRQMSAKVFYDGKQIELDSSNSSLWSDTSICLYYAEYNMANKTVSVYGRNVEDGKIYTARLWANGNSGASNICGQCEFSFTDGQAEIEFFTDDGEKYIFDPSISEYGIGFNDNASTYLTNPTYTYTYTYTYPETVDNQRRSYVNDGSLFNTGVSLNASVLTDDSVVTAELVDGSGTSLAETAVSIRKYQSDSNGAYWYLAYAFADVELANDSTYYVKVRSEDKDLGTMKVYVLDPAKIYYTYSSVNYVADSSEMVLGMNGYWNDTMQADKFKIEISSASGTKLATMNGKKMDVTDYGVSLTFDCSAYRDILKEYRYMRYKVFYNDQEIPYAYGTDNSSRTIWVSVPNDTGYLINTKDSKTNVSLATGVYSYVGKALNVYIYYPYGTTALKTIQYAETTGAQTYEFTADQLEGLKYGLNGKMYDVLLTDADGNFISMYRTYLNAVKEFKFTDVSENSWMYKGVDYVYQKGIMTGKASDKFDPNGAMTRAEFVTTLYSMQGKPSVNYENKFTDVAKGQWYTNSVMWAYQNSVVSGYANGAFGTSDKITREQLALMLYKYAKDTCGVETTFDKDVLERFADKNKISSWSKEALQWAVTNGVMSGKGENLDPRGNATRAECAAMLRSFDINIIK